MTAAANICAQCKHFRMKEYPEHAREGLGRCMGYDGTMAELKNPFYAWGTKACTRFKMDFDGKAQRDAWIEKKRAQAA